MEETNFVLLWKEHYQKIDQSLIINKRLLTETIQMKAHNALQSLTRLKQRGIVALVIYLVLLALVLYYSITNYSSALNYFIISMSVIFVINIKALYDYIKHIVWVNKINYNGSITDTQQQLIKLQLSIYQHSRIMVLQLPFWTTFFLSDKWFPHAVGWQYYIFQSLLTGSFTYGAYWLYKNQTAYNANKKWFKFLIAGSGGASVSKALVFYQELEKFKQDA